ncbi:hypothetical protein [Endozoicomonas montiporae]|nr:hypothetical protein [Endozoicomonas montiporae]AMO58764.1 hypothetical protein EZMO1_4873 [Endozoicomonas montiporae CL-33]
MDSWRGHHIEEVVANWGAPSSSLKLTDGRSIYSWVSNWGSAYLLNTCRQSFTTDRNNIIQNWRFTGCPQWQTLSVKDVSEFFPQKN